MTSVDFDWRRYAVIGEIADRMQDKGNAFGKTALQKLVYFLQELHGVDMGYEFSLYTYGPFSSALMADLDTAKELGVVSVKYEGPTAGYSIEPGPSKRIRDKAREFTEQNQKAIEDTVTEFGGRWARELELRATILFVERDAWSSGDEPAAGKVVETVHDLKPHFSDDQIRGALNELVDRGYVNVG